MAIKKNKADSASDQDFSEKLASSGLTLEDAKLLQMTVVPNAQTLASTFNPVKALRLPYFDLKGRATNFYRIRYLGHLNGFAGQAAKPQRYAQEPKTLNEAYLPPIFDWSPIAADVSRHIVITEGELKAACACKHGLPTIGLGGVTVWRSSKKNVALLSPLDKINWKGREVYIIFDSDAATNPMVAAAQVSLCRMLLEHGAVAKVANLPPTLDNEKQGLDDFLVAGGNINQVLQITHSLELADRLLACNERYVYLEDQDLVCGMKTFHRHKRDSFTHGLEAANNVTEFITVQNAPPKVVKVSVPKAWLSWPAKKSVAALTYAPGEPLITDRNELNSWSGWGCEPIKGDVKPWISLLIQLFGTAKIEMEWFQRWCALPLQQPGAKMFTSAVIWGPETGTGKTLVGETLGQIYGENYAAIGNVELHAPFNDWAANKQFILGDEITGSDRRHEADRLKAMITQSKLRINMKNLPVYTVPDRINYYFTSNHPDAFFIDDHDRRFFIWRTANPRQDPVFYTEYIRWLDNGGREALFYHLLHLDIRGFNPRAPAPSTDSKSEMTEHARSDLSHWVAGLLRDPGRYLVRLSELHCKPHKIPDLVLNRHLLGLYERDNGGTPGRVTAIGLGRELTRFGVKTLPPLRSKTLGQQRFYILQNYEKWKNMTPIDTTKYIDSIYNKEII